MEKRNITKKGIEHKEKMFNANFLDKNHGEQVLVESIDKHHIAVYHKGQLIGVATEVGVEEQKCRICGCTWNSACKGGCYWVEKDLCSKCIES